MVALYVLGGLVGLFLLAWFAHDVLWQRVWFRTVTYRRRHRAARAAATSAALEDAAFDPDVLEARAREIWHEVNDAILARSLAGVDGLVAPAYRARLERMLAREAEVGTGTRWVLAEGKELGVRLVSVSNRSGTGSDRVALTVESLATRYTKVIGSTEPRDARTEWLGEYLVLGRDGDGWVLVDRLHWDEGADELDARLIDEPAQDLERLTDATLQELASAGAIAARVDQLVDAGDPVPEQVASLSALDGRFATPVLEASVRTILRAWDSASFDAGAELLERCASAAVVDELLGSPPRLARGGRLTTLTPIALRAEEVVCELAFDARIPRRDVPEAELEKGEGWRYHWTTRWTLGLDTTPGRPWVLRSAGELVCGGFA